MARSPNYPAIGLSEAVNQARMLWKQDERTPVTEEAAVSAFGYTALSGSARTTLSALKKYGLVEDTPQGVRISQLAVQILHNPVGSDDYVQAIQEAALTPELFQQLAEHHIKGSEDSLRRYLLTRLDFSETGAQKCARAFRDTIEFASLDGSGYTGENGAQEPEKKKEQAPVTTVAQSDAATPRVARFSWPLSRDVSVEVTFTGADVRPFHIDTLRKYLDTAKSAIGDSEGGDTEGEA